MTPKVEKKSAPKQEAAKVLGATFEAGKPEQKDMGMWRQKLGGREEKLRYLQTAERYWFSKEWYGSEKRKNPA